MTALACSTVTVPDAVATFPIGFVSRLAAGDCAALLCARTDSGSMTLPARSRPVTNMANARNSIVPSWLTCAPNIEFNPNCAVEQYAQRLFYLLGVEPRVSQQH